MFRQNLLRQLEVNGRRHFHWRNMSSLYHQLLEKLDVSVTLFPCQDQCCCLYAFPVNLRHSLLHFVRFHYNAPVQLLHCHFLLDQRRCNWYPLLEMCCLQSLLPTLLGYRYRCIWQGKDYLQPMPEVCSLDWFFYLLGMYTTGPESSLIIIIVY